MRKKSFRVPTNLLHHPVRVLQQWSLLPLLHHHRKMKFRRRRRGVNRKKRNRNQRRKRKRKREREKRLCIPMLLHKNAEKIKEETLKTMKKDEWNRYKLNNIGNQFLYSDLKKLQCMINIIIVNIVLHSLQQEKFWIKREYIF